MAAKTILVVDKDIITIKKIMKTLEAEGFLVLNASNKFSGLRAAKALKPSIIFINIGIIGASGLEMCQMIQADKTLNDIPIVIIKPREDATDFQDAILYDRVKVLETSFTPEQLISVTYTVLADNPITMQNGDEKALEHRINLYIENEQLGEPRDAEKPISIRNEEHQFEERVIAQPIEEQKEVYLADKYFSSKESPDEKKEKPVIQHTDEELGSLNVLSAEGGKEQGEKHAVKNIIEKTNSQFFSNDITPPQLQDKPLLKQSTGKNERKSFSVLLVLMIGIIGVGGYLFFRTFIQVTSLPATKEKSSSLQGQREIPSQQHLNDMQTAQDTQEHKPAEPTALETNPEAKPLYAVQIGAFSDKANARSFRKHWQEKGYDATIKKIKTKDNKIFYKIFIGSFESRKEAIEAARSISTKEEMQTIIVRR